MRLFNQIFVALLLSMGFYLLFVIVLREFGVDLFFLATYCPPCRDFMCPEICLPKDLTQAFNWFGVAAYLLSFVLAFKSLRLLSKTLGTLLVFSVIFGILFILILLSWVSQSFL